MTNYESKSFNLVLVQVIGPALIMLMVGSLVFFFIEVFYRGPHSARLYWVMSFFTFASVLVSRVSIVEGRERAQLLGIALAIATLISCSRLIEFSYGNLALLGPLVIAALIGIVMWSSAKLTWDCTVVDRSRDASETGLIDRVRQNFQSDTTKSDTLINGEPKTKIRRNRLISWLLGAKKSNSPGMWVFYFAIFAFPLFGFGQWFVQQESKNWIFVLFAVYLASTLCLLMTTSLLGLERYLAKRNLHVPGPIARNWILVGSIFAILVMLLVSLLPKPTSSNQLQNVLAFLSSPDRNSSKLAVGNDRQVNVEGAKKTRVNKEGDRVIDNDDSENDGGENSKSSEKNGDESESSQNENGEGSDNSAIKNPNRETIQTNETENQNVKSKEAKSNSQTKRGAEKPTNQTNKGSDDKPHDQKNDEELAQRGEPNENKNQVQRGKQNDNGKDQKFKNNDNRQVRQKAESSFDKAFHSLGKALNWLVYIVGLLAALFLIWMFRKELLGLFGSEKEQHTDTLGEDVGQIRETKLPPFSSFANPFESGQAKEVPIQQLLQYSMSALEAWAREFGCHRGPDVTPDEFAQEISRLDPIVSQYARRLADQYGKFAFGAPELQKVSRETFDPLVKLWRQMGVSVVHATNTASVV